MCKFKHFPPWWVVTVHLDIFAYNLISLFFSFFRLKVEVHGKIYQI